MNLLTPEQARKTTWLEFEQEQRILRDQWDDIAAFEYYRWLHAFKGKGFLYAVEFETGVLKLGMTKSPRRRIGQHKQSAVKHGTRVIDLWLSPPHAHYQQAERELLQFGATHGERVTGRGEYFHGLSIDDVACHGLLLSFTSINEFAGHCVRYDRFVKYSAERLAQIQQTVAIMTRGAAGDLSMSAVDAYKRGLALSP